MIHLYLALSIVTLLACLAVIYPWLKKQQSLYSDSNRLKVLFTDKLNELDADLAQEKLSADEYNGLKQELTEQLAIELREHSDGQQKSMSRKWIWFLPPLTLVATFVIYKLQHKPAQMEQWFNAQQVVSEVGKKILMGDGPSNRAEMESFYLGLRGQLNRSPDDSTGWFLLGRVGYSLGYLNEAVAAFEKSLALDANNYSTNMSYAQALITQGEDSALRQAARIYAKVLKNNAEDAEALTMSGFIAMQLEQPKMAANFWQRALKYLPANDSRRGAIVQTLDEMQASKNDEPTQQTDDASTNQTLLVNLALSATTQASLTQFKYLWLFARSGQAGPPAAVRRIKLQEVEFPLQVKLSDADAMMPVLTLSTLQEVVVTARLTETDDVMQTEQVQLEVKSDMIKLTDNLAIDIEL